MKKRGLRITGIGLALVVGTAGWIVGVQRTGDHRGTAVEARRSVELDVPFTVQVTPPSNPSQILFGTTVEVPVATEAHGPADVRRLELWDGDRIVGVREITGDTSSSAQALFTWPASRLGAHLLFARALTASGQTSVSPMLPVKVVTTSWQLTRPPTQFAIPDWVHTASQAASFLGVPSDRLVVDPGAAKAETAAHQPQAPVTGVVGVALPGVSVDIDPQAGTAPLPVKGSAPEAPAPNPGSTVPDDSPEPTTTVPPASSPGAPSVPGTVPKVTTPPPASVNPPDDSPLTQPSSPQAAPGTTPSQDTPKPSATTPKPTVTTPKPTVTSPSAPVITTPPGPYSGESVPGTDLPPASIALKGCDVTVTLKAASNEPTKVFHGSTGKGWPNQVGKIAAGSKSFTFGPVMPGVQVVILESGTGKGKLSIPLSVTAPAACAEKSGWSGPTSIIDGTLTVPKPGKGYYVYIRPQKGANQSNTNRIPIDPHEFIDAATTKVDVAPLIPHLGDLPDAVMELWQVEGTAAKLVASAQLTPPGNANVQTIIGQANAVDLTVGGSHEWSMTKDAKVTFSFSASRGDVIVWQAFASPIDRMNTSLNPPGVLGVGAKTIATGYDVDKNTFAIDTAKIPRAGASSGASPTTTKPGSGTPADGAGLLTAPAPLDMAALVGDKGDVEVAKWASGFEMPDVGSFSPLAVTRQANDLSTYPGPDVWVRALAYDDDEGVVGIASPWVHLDFPAPAAQGPLTVTDVGVDPPFIPNPAWQACASVDVPWDAGGFSWTPPDDVAPATIAALKKAYPHSGLYCRVDKAPPSISQELSDVLVLSGAQFLGFYDSFVDAYNYVVASAAKLLAEWNPICKLAGSAQATCKAWTEAIGAAALKAGMMLLGLPPSLPSSAQVIDSTLATIEGDLSGMAEQWMKQVGVPCEQLTWDAKTLEAATPILDKAGVDADDPDLRYEGKINLCRGVARVMLHKMESGAREAIASALSQALGGPSIPDPIQGMNFTPDPRGSWAPFTAWVTAKSTEPGLAPAFSCTFTPVGWLYNQAFPLTLTHRKGDEWGGLAVFQRTGESRLISYIPIGDEPAYFTNPPPNDPDANIVDVTVGANPCTGTTPFTGSAKLKPVQPGP